MNDLHKNGKIPINKCLNDFLGFRIFVDDLESIYDSLQKSSIKNQKIRMYLREDGDYKGIHLYFKNGKNVYFPWELQIWDIKDSILNENLARFISILNYSSQVHWSRFRMF